MFSADIAKDRRLAAMQRLISLSTVCLLVAGLAASVVWVKTGDPGWIRKVFDYPGALFLVGCSLLAFVLSYRCWQQFSKGDLLRPAWLLITLSAAAHLAGATVTQIFGTASRLNPLWWTHPDAIPATRSMALHFGPLYMVFLAGGLFYVLKACRLNGILGRLRLIDILLLGIVFVYTIIFFATVVFSAKQEQPITAERLVSWASDPLLFVLLFEAILIRRSTANMGWGLISRCWLAVTASIFLTSVGDISLWAAGHWPYALEVASWHLWFLASAAWALAPSWQLQAMLRATRGQVREDELTAAFETVAR